MALELQLSTANAQKALNQIESSLAELQAKLGSFSGTTSLETTLQRIASIKFDSSAASAISKLSAALNTLSSGGNITRVSSELNTLANVKLSGVTSSVSGLSVALKGVRAPSSLGTIAAGFQKVGSAASAAAAPVGNFASALNRVQAPAGLQGAVGGLQNVGSAAQRAASSVSSFGSTIGGVSGLLNGFGVALGGVGLAQFARASYDASTAVTQFNARIASTGEGTLNAAEQLDYVRKAADGLALPVNDAGKAYSKLLNTLGDSAQGVETSRRIFEGFGTIFRAMGLNAEQAKRGFQALDQIMSKGTVSMEELKQQLGELFPAFNDLSKSMGVSTAELAKLIAQGKVSSDVMGKFADDLKEKYGRGLAEALNSPQAAFQRLSNAATNALAEIGETFYGSMVPAINALASALNKPDFLSAAKGAAELAGVIAGALASALAFAVDNFRLLSAALAAFAAYRGVIMIAGLVSALSGLAAIVPPVVTAVRAAALSFVLLTGAMSTTGTAAAASSGIFARIAGAVALISPPVRIAIIAFTALGAGLGYLTGVSQTFASAWDAATAWIVSKIQDLWEGFRSIAPNTVAALEGAAVAIYDWVNSTVAAMTAWGTGVYNAVVAALTGVGEYISAQFSAIFAYAQSQISAFVAWVSPALAPIAAAFQFVGQVAQEVFAYWTTSAAAAGQSTQVAGQATGEYAGAATQAASASGDLAAEVESVSTSADGVASSAASAAGGLTDMAAAADSSAAGVTAAAVASEDLSQAANNASQSASNMGASVGSAGGAANSAGAALVNSANSAYQAAAAYSAAAAAARELAAAQRGIGGGGGGGGGGGAPFASSEFFAGGGISHKGGTSTAQVPVGAFANAPLLASGTPNTDYLNGGGIPAILHPNEAVIPLTGGGKVPVDISGMSQSSGSSTQLRNSAGSAMRVFDDQLAAQRSTALEAARVFEAVTANTTLSETRGKTTNEWLNKVHTELVKINAEIANALRVSKVSTSGTTGTSSSGLGSTGSIALTIDTPAPTQQRRKGAGYGSSTGAGGGPGTLGGDGIDYYAREKTAAFLKKLPFVGITGPIGGIGAHLSANIGSGYFAEGSPNAFEDVRGGGFHAVLHPDEAVIPLPDGRSVPVSMPRFMEESHKMFKATAQQQSRKASSNFLGNDMRIAPSSTQRQGQISSQPVEVKIYVTTKDADSFRRSQDQIVQELETKLDRVRTVLGSKSSVDNPTALVARRRGDR